MKHKDLEIGDRVLCDINGKQIWSTVVKGDYYMKENDDVFRGVWDDDNQQANCELNLIVKHIPAKVFNSKLYKALS